MFGFSKKKVPDGMLGEQARIVELLQAVKDQSALVSLQIPGSSTWYDTKIVAIDPRQGLLALERLQEERIHKRISEIRRFAVLTRCNGVISFNTELMLKEGEVNRYVIRIPEYIEYRARRVATTSISGIKSAAITLMGMGRMVRGYISSISRTDLELRTRDIVAFQPGDEIASCTFELLGVSVSCRFKLLSTQLDTIAHDTRLKGELLDISEAQIWELDRAIAQLSQEQKADEA